MKNLPSELDRYPVCSIRTRYVISKELQHTVDFICVVPFASCQYFCSKGFPEFLYSCFFVETFCTYTIYDEATDRVDVIYHPWPIQSLYIFFGVLYLLPFECFCSKGFRELLYVFVETFCTYSIYDPMEFYVIHVYHPWPVQSLFIFSVLYCLPFMSFRGIYVYHPWPVQSL